MAELFGLGILLAGLVIFVREFFTRDVDLLFRSRAMWPGVGAPQKSNGNGRLRK